MTTAKDSHVFRFSVAPMMDWTDRHCRAFHRTLSRCARLYTEMVTTAAILHGDQDRLLGFSGVEQPLAVQLGGNDPSALAETAAICSGRGFSEINLNVGCPSNRVQNGAFGACLMREPELVGACVEAMKGAVSVPVTVKCRLGVDDQPPGTLDRFADIVVAAGADALIVHARKAWLQGLSPRENRTVPPLDYAQVFALKQRMPDVPIILNGGLSSWDMIADVIGRVDGVMIGRAAYSDPALLMSADEALFEQPSRNASREQAVRAFLPYIDDRVAAGVPLHSMTRHMLGLFNGLPGARSWRRRLATEAVRPRATSAVVEQALDEIASATARLAA